jgi:CubicO group peptidase (beta-lactamase class C family)
VQVQLAGLRYFAVAAADPPHLLTGLRGYPLAERISDPRTKQPPPARTSGQPPGQVAAIAGAAFAELGLPALVLAGGQPGRAPWVLAQGHADLDTDDQLDPGHLLPAPGVTALVTATAVLALVAEGRVGLDDPVNRHLRSVRLASPAVTLRDLLSHRGGVDEPEQVYAGQVPTLAGLMGPVIGCHGPRGTVNPSNAGYQVLGQLVADVTRLAFAEAARRLVLSPLGMRASVFPHSAAELARDDIARCYTVTRELAFAPSPPQVPVLQAVAGLWSTGADLVRLGTGWPSLLPAELARAALTDQARADQARADQARADQAPVGRPEPQTHPPVGLGWLLDPHGRTAVHAGGMPDAGALLRVRLRDLRTHVILTTRQIAIAATDERLTQVWTDPDQPTGGTTP